MSGVIFVRGSHWVHMQFLLIQDPSSDSATLTPPLLCSSPLYLPLVQINTLLPLCDQLLSSSVFLLQITVLSGKCSLLSICPRGAAYWRKSSCSHPGRGSRSGACWSCTAGASFTWASEIRSSRSRSRDAATTRAESECARKNKNTINLNGDCQKQICTQRRFKAASFIRWFLSERARPVCWSGGLCWDF